MSKHVADDFNTALQDYGISCFAPRGYNLIEFLDKNTGRKASINLSRVTKRDIEDFIKQLLLPSNEFHTFSKGNLGARGDKRLERYNALENFVKQHGFTLDYVEDGSKHIPTPFYCLQTIFDELQSRMQ